MPVKRFPLFVLAMILSAQAPAQTDTLCIKSYYHNLVPRFLTNYKNQFTSFVTRQDTLYSVDYFSTGSQNFIGAELSYKWASFGYNFTFDKENTSTNTDLRVSTSYKPLHLHLNYTNLKNLNYYRVNGDDQADTVFTTRQHNIVLRTAGLKMEYVFDYKKFYYSSSFSQNGRQLKSKGSFILSAGVSSQNFDLRGLSDSTRLIFLDRYSASEFKALRIDLGPGYAYNWVIKKNLVISVSDIPNIGFQQINTSENSMHVNQRNTLSLTNYVRGAVIYSWNNMFIGAYAYNAITVSRWFNYDYNNVYTSLQLYFNLVLDDPQDYWKKRSLSRRLAD